MKRILLFGAGRSSPALIRYLTEYCIPGGASLTIVDKHAPFHLPEGVLFETQDVHDTQVMSQLIRQADVVVSLLPPAFQFAVAQICVEQQRHFFCASYASQEMQNLNNVAIRSGLLILNECGLDPGIDHMSTMLLLDTLREEEAEIISLRSFTGGLINKNIASENPWLYKFTWNPRNVILAGQDNAAWLENGKNRAVDYKKLFKTISTVEFPDGEIVEGYPNRDSLQYKIPYGLVDVQTLLRGTLRYVGFCDAWNVFVQLGCCDDTISIENLSDKTHADFIRMFLPNDHTVATEELLVNTLHLNLKGHEMRCLRWSGMFSNESIGVTSGTPASILEHILNKKWKLNADDRDRVVMWHEVKYKKDNAIHVTTSSLSLTGSEQETAMAKTVGLPLGIAVKSFLDGKINSRGVVIPVTREIYLPILSELEENGIKFIHQKNPSTDKNGF